MEEINIAEILKDCPKGMKLYSPAYGYVYLKSVDFRKVIDGDDYIEIGIKVELGNAVSYIQCFNEYGKIPGSEYSECMLFPSKDQRNWSRFEPIVPVSYFIGDYGKIWVKKGEDTEEDIERKEFGNDFATFEQAEYAAKEVKKLFLSLRKEAE